jgi:uncharacterized protein
MKLSLPEHKAPDDAPSRKGVRPVICYPVGSLDPPDLTALRAARVGWRKTADVIVPPREARSFEVPAGYFFRIISVEGAQVGDLNLWARGDITERFFLRQDTRPAWHASLHGGQALVEPAFSQAIGDDHRRHAGLVWL